MMTEFTNQPSFKRNGKAFRVSKKNLLLYSTNGADENDEFLQKLQQRSVSLTALHATASSGKQYLEPGMAQLESLEAKMANIEVSLSATPRRKKSSSVSGGIMSPSSHRNREHYKELDSLRVALRDKENIIQTLKGQLCTTLSSRLALRNGAPPLTEADRKATEERLQRLKRDTDNKRLAIKNLKLALERLDITDNIDVRIQQAELEYRLGREELELLTLKEESRALQTALEFAETQEKQKNDTIFSCITGSTQLTVHALEVGADPKSPRFGAGPRDNAAGLYIDWAVEDSGLCKGDRILEVNGKLVVGAGRSELARLLAVATDAAQLVVLRRNDSLAALRTLRSDNLRLTHRISYLEEQVRDLLAPRTEISADLEAAAATASPRQEHLQVFQKGPQVTALVSSGLALRTSNAASDDHHHHHHHHHHRQSLPNVKAGPNSRQDYPTSSTDGLAIQQRPSRSSRHSSGKLQQQQQQQLTKSTASLETATSNLYTSASPSRRRAPRIDEQIRAQSSSSSHKSRKSKQLFLQSHEVDSEPTYYRRQDTQSRASEHSEASLTAHSTQEYSNSASKSRPAPPKKPLRLSLHRATSLQSVESAPPCTSSEHPGYAPSKKPTKRNYRGDPPLMIPIGSSGAHQENGGELSASASALQQQQQQQQQQDCSAAPQPPPRTPSRAESCQSALRWTSPKPKTTSHLPQFSLEKWC